MPHPCIYINGFPGVGKLTVAKELQRLLPHSKIFHNHLLIDPVAAILDRTSPEYDTMRTELRQYLLDKIATSESNKDTTWIFTDSRCTSEIGSAAARDYEKTAEKMGAPFVSVIMTCDAKVNMERVVSRTDNSSTKLRDVEVLRSMREQEEIFRFGGARELELDVSYLSPEQAALRILNHVQLTNILRHAQKILEFVEGRASPEEWDEVESARVSGRGSGDEQSASVTRNQRDIGWSDVGH